MKVAMLLLLLLMAKSSSELVEGGRGSVYFTARYQEKSRAGLKPHRQGMAEARNGGHVAQLKVRWCGCPTIGKPST